MNVSRLVRAERGTLFIFCSNYREKELRLSYLKDLINCFMSGINSRSICLNNFTYLNLCMGWQY